MTGDPTAKDAALVYSPAPRRALRDRGLRAPSAVAKDCGYDGIADPSGRPDAALDESQADKLLTKIATGGMFKAGVNERGTDRLLPGSSIGGVRTIAADGHPADCVDGEPRADRVRDDHARYREWLKLDARARTELDYDDLAAVVGGRALEEFWASIWDFFDVIALRSRTSAFSRRAARCPARLTGSRARGSAAPRSTSSATATTPLSRISHASELRPLSTTGRGESCGAGKAGAIAEALREVGRRGRRTVCRRLPPETSRETIAAFLGRASIGAIWSSCAPEFGIRSVVDRFGPDRAEGACSQSTATPLRRQATSTAPRYGRGAREELPTCSSVTLRAPVLAGGDWELPPGRSLEFAQLAFDHPLWVLYSSGTTGLPKAIVHGQGGILLEHLKKLHLHVDAHPGDRLFWFTTTGWMMWNFLVGALLSEASVVLFDGNPAYPNLGTLWDLADAAGITCFGTSAGFIASCHKEGVQPTAGRDLSRLDSVGSTGSPLSPEGFDWVRDELGPDSWLFSTSGGTDMCTAFVGGVPTLPVYRGELQARALGAKVEAWSEDGVSLVGEVGELVVTEPMPSMPLYLWGDADGLRYRESYFSTFPGVWRHGDWIEITERGTAIITGRSDATINRGGVRMGTSELYRSVLALPEIVDALVVDVPQGDASRMSLFVVLRNGAELDDVLLGEIKRRIREDCSPRHVPDEILAAPAIPRTLSGKVLEVPVKRLLTGAARREVASRDSLANPEALDWFAEFANN